VKPRAAGTNTARSGGRGGATPRIRGGTH
jgi:hypothetical protein